MLEKAPLMSSELPCDVILIFPKREVCFLQIHVKHQQRDSNLLIFLSTFPLKLNYVSTMDKTFHFCSCYKKPLTLFRFLETI